MKGQTSRMNIDKRKSWASTLRVFFLRIIPLSSVIIIDIFFLILLDNLFDSSKRNWIVDAPEFSTKMNLIVDPFREKFSNVVNNRKRTKTYNEFKKLIEQEFHDITPSIIQEQTHPWFQIIISDNFNEKIYQFKDESKLALYNNWSNCFLSRNFQRRINVKSNVPFLFPDQSGKIVLNLEVYYTTPLGWSSIEEKAKEYRRFALVFVLLSWIIFYVLHREVFRPLQRIGRAIEQMIQSGGVTIIPHAKQATEIAFNRLAKNQRETMFGLEVETIVDQLNALADDEPLLERFLNGLVPAIQTIYPLIHLTAFKFEKDKKHFLPLTISHKMIPFVEIKSFEDQGIETNTKAEIWILLVVGNQSIGGISAQVHPDSQISIDERIELGCEIKKQTENGLARAFTRSQILTEERNRFGINLATNMGHDLTNIIASGKWDLSTIQRAQKAGIVSLDSRKGPIYQEAVDGLYNNLHFLQEMVNIYRSVGYTRRPTYEQFDLKECVEEITTIFRLSTSQKLSIEIINNPSIQIFAEPRLLKMAIFNLLTNAAQAIRQNPHQPDGMIQLSVLESSNQNITISIADNGPGIRNREDELLDKTQISCIFQSGYSTKGEGSGGGLGLAWVQSIIEEFHNGRIEAINRNQGGAEFLIQIPKGKSD
jgi:signal transduction histidine kinase